MSMPIILAAALLKVPDAVRETGIARAVARGRRDRRGLELARDLGPPALRVQPRIRDFITIYRFVLGAVIIGLIATRGGW